MIEPTTFRRRLRRRAGLRPPPSVVHGGARFEDGSVVLHAALLPEAHSFVIL